jgi:hypothetical protein
MNRDRAGAVLQARRRPVSREYTVGTLPQFSREDNQDLRHMDAREVGGHAGTRQSNIRMNVTALRAARYPARSRHNGGGQFWMLSFADLNYRRTRPDFPHASGHDRPRKGAPHGSTRRQGCHSHPGLKRAAHPLRAIACLGGHPVRPVYRARSTGAACRAGRRPVAPRLWWWCAGFLAR